MAVTTVLAEAWEYQQSLDSKVKINIVAAPCMMVGYIFLFDAYGIQNAALGMLAMSLAKAILQFNVELYENSKKVAAEAAAAASTASTALQKSSLSEFLNKNKASLGLELLGLSYTAFMAGLPHLLKSTTSIDENTFLYLQPSIDNFAVLMMIAIVSTYAEKFKLFGKEDGAAQNISEQLGSCLIKHKNDSNTYQPLELGRPVWHHLDRLMMLDAFVGFTMGLTAYILFQGLDIGSLHVDDNQISEDKWLDLSNVYTKISFGLCLANGLYTLWTGRKQAIESQGGSSHKPQGS